MGNLAKRPYIEHGVGRYTAPPNGAMNYEDTMEFIESHCVNSELYQDVKLALDKKYEHYVKSMLTFFKSHDYFFCTKMRISDTHKVMTIEVIAHRKPRGEGTYFQYHRAGDVIVLLNDDGLICDILPLRPNMNPAGERVVWNKKP